MNDIKHFFKRIGFQFNLGMSEHARIGLAITKEQRKEMEKRGAKFVFYENEDGVPVLNTRESIVTEEANTWLREDIIKKHNEIRYGQEQTKT